MEGIDKLTSLCIDNLVRSNIECSEIFHKYPHVRIFKCQSNKYSKNEGYQSLFQNLNNKLTIYIDEDTVQIESDTIGLKGAYNPIDVFMAVNRHNAHSDMTKIVLVPGGLKLFSSYTWRTYAYTEKDILVYELASSAKIIRELIINSLKDAQIILSYFE